MWALIGAWEQNWNIYANCNILFDLVIVCYALSVFISR